MWFFLAVLSTLFVGVSTVLSKVGIRDADPYAVNAVNNTVLLAAFGGMAVYSGTFGQVREMTMSTWISVAVSGAILSVSWMFYYLGLKAGNISIFLAIQSFSIVFSMVLCRIFIKEEITGLMLAGTALIIGGTLLMMEKTHRGGGNRGLGRQQKKWILFSFLSAVFSAVSYVIVKADTAPIDTNVTSFFRYAIVTGILWVLVVSKGKTTEFARIERKSWVFILLGAAASGAGHVLVYKALFFGKASVVITVYRMGMVISIILSKLFLREKLSLRGWTGFGLLTLGVALFAAGRS